MESQKPAQSLEEARQHMRFAVLPGRFALVGFSEPPAPEDWAWASAGGPGQLIREGGETTLLVPEEALAACRQRHPGLRAERSLAWIRFEAAMGWELVGFLALVTGHLARRGVPLGAVCGFSRDHLFVAEVHLETTRAALAELFPESTAR